MVLVGWVKSNPPAACGEALGRFDFSRTGTTEVEPTTDTPTACCGEIYFKLVGMR